MDPIRFSLSFKIKQVTVADEDIVYIALSNDEVTAIINMSAKGINSGMPSEIMQVSRSFGLQLQSMVPKPLIDPRKDTTIIVTKEQYVKMGRPRAGNSITFNTEYIDE